MGFICLFLPTTADRQAFHLPGFEAGKDAWRWLTSQFPDMRVVAEEILVDGGK
jgi:hypothetical protein